MNAAGRLGLYGAGLVVAFGAAFGLAGAIVPDSVVDSWKEGDTMSMSEHAGTDDAAGHGAHAPQGLAVSENGYVLSPVTAPGTVGAAGRLQFAILDPAGSPVTDYTEQHDKDLHLIVVRSDGAEFRHVHPQLDEATGTWSLPWTWDAAGVYRVYTDFTPAGADAGMTLTRTVEVAGDFTPVDRAPSTTAQVDGYTVTLDGTLTAGDMSDLTMSVSRAGTPVTTLQPYLGAFGHLVALREGDLAYLHVHPDSDAPAADATGGPDIGFMATAPTPGRYLLYLDFQVDGRVRTAEFVVDAGTDKSNSGTMHSGSSHSGHH